MTIKSKRDLLNSAPSTAYGVGMTLRQVMDFIRYHGVVLEAAKGAEPCLAQKIAGEPIKGSWWGHEKGQEIYALTQKVHESKAVLICTLAHGKITYIHRRLWPYFICLANCFPLHALDKVREVHLASGRHERQDIPFPDWVPVEFKKEAKSISLREARDVISVWLDRYGVT